jgi:hypothetical protein
VERYAHEWEEHANIEFIFGDDKDAQIRISFSADTGSWSAVGTDALNAKYFPRYQPTMNFGWLKDATENSEYRRVVLHEFGHALGCIHEHESPNETLQWDENAVYEYFSGAPNYWSKADIKHNVLSRYSAKGMKFTRFDRASIMLYMFPGTLFKTGKGTPNNTNLSPGDKQFIGTLYPFPKPKQSKRKKTTARRRKGVAALDMLRGSEEAAPTREVPAGAVGDEIAIPDWI